MIQQIHEGLIGEAYMAKAWYANTRGATHYGEPSTAPPDLNWDLWQGPAPRSEYRANIHPYNWHWLRRYGTGETLNNGTHEVDICRWALQAEFPQAVTAIWRLLSVQRRLAVLRHAHHQLRVSRQAHLLGRPQPPGHARLRSRSRLEHHGHQRFRCHRPRRLRCLRLEGQTDRYFRTGHEASTAI